MVKVGDKVRVTTDACGPRHPKGTLGTVGHVWSNCDIVMTDDRGQERYLSYGEYEPIPADKPDPRDDPSNPDNLKLRDMTPVAIGLIVAGIAESRTDFWHSGLGKWKEKSCAGVSLFRIYRLRPRTVRIQYDCDENGNPIMDTGREVG